MARATFRDPGLGQLTWAATGWRFSFALTRRRSGRATIIAQAPEPKPAANCLAAVSRYVRWFRRNDSALRSHITKAMYRGWRSNWYDPKEDSTCTPVGFQRKLNLAGINFYWDDDWVSVVYNDGGLFGGHGIELSTDLDGKITGKPSMFG